ncbi:trehalase-like domain-containing protein [Archangium sp.]|uniref:trehalase-like domain-containing protein n=1 Tax=Archangium sp. TaxID=1872627 RepID=UPI00389A10FD
MRAPPISDYALLSDCPSALLVSRRGSVDWLGLPRFDSPSVLGRLLGTGAGHRVLRQVKGRSHRRYLERTLVLETPWPGAPAAARGGGRGAGAGRRGLRGVGAGLVNAAWAIAQAEERQRPAATRPASGSDSHSRLDAL